MLPASDGYHAEKRRRGAISMPDEEHHISEADETMKRLEDDPPKNLEDWPDDEAKYLTFGGGEGDHGYEEGPRRTSGHPACATTRTAR